MADIDRSALPSVAEGRELCECMGEENAGGARRAGTADGQGISRFRLRNEEGAGGFPDAQERRRMGLRALVATGESRARIWAGG